MMRLASAARTGRGDRAVNEDAFEIATGAGHALFVVADGLGGHGGGAAAAQCCVAGIAARFARAPGLADLQALVDAADRAVADLRGEREAPRDSMRTTVALLAVCGDVARWAHVGDTRIYWFRDAAPVFRTRDHSVAEVAGSDDPGDRSRLLRAVGSGRGVAADIGDAVTIASGDAFLLCSDGVWNLLNDGEIAAGLATARTPELWCAALERSIGAGPAGEDKDNFTLIAVMVE